jgi:hypothetical protein
VFLARLPSKLSLFKGLTKRHGYPLVNFACQADESDQKMARSPLPLEARAGILSTRLRRPPRRLKLNDALETSRKALE